MKMKIAFLSLLLGSALTAVPAKADLALTSEDVHEQETLIENQVFNGFGCMGGNLSPQLAWEGAPEGTKSFALTMYDPDAPTGSGWWHWVAFNIPATTTSLELGASGTSMPEGTIESITDFGSAGYGGACPPEDGKEHRYIFTLHAVDVEKLPDLDDKSSGAKVGYFLHTHTLEKKSITGLFKRDAAAE